MALEKDERDLIAPFLQEIRAEGWIPAAKIGKGGGGTVFRCFRAEAIAQFLKFGKEGGSIQNDEYKLNLALEVLDAGYSASIGTDSVGALKVPNNSEDGLVLKRITRETNTLASVSHPNVVRLLSYNKSATRWFVMEYHPNGSLALQQRRYHGKPLEVLQRIRPVVEALAIIHHKKYVHRDIKPGNILLARDGSWILSDFGIVQDEKEDLTLTGQTIFSKHWRPDWVDIQGLELEKYLPTVDIFMLAKVIYYLISGINFPASQINQPKVDLREALKGVDGIELVYDTLKGCIVTDEKDMKAQSAKEFLPILDEMIDSLSGKEKSRLLFSFVPTQIGVPISTPAGPPRSDNLDEIPVLLRKRTSNFAARARVSYPHPTGEIKIRFSVAGKWSPIVTMNGPIAPPGAWTPQISLRLEKPLDPNWYGISLDMKAPEQGGTITGFVVYAV